MADADAKSSTTVVLASTAGSTSSSIPTDKWLTHLPVFAKCNHFNGNNLLVWERTVQTALRPRKLGHHLTEDSPNEEHVEFMKWTIEEEFVFAWLLDSLAPEQQAQFISCDTSRKLWESIRRNHSKQGHKSKIINLISKSFSLKQDDKDVITYSNELHAIYHELDHCYPLSTNRVARDREATTRLCIFLQGLRPEFEIIRSQLFNREIEPTFDEAISKVKGEESRLKALQIHIESSAYLTKGQKNSASYPKKNEHTNKDHLVCSFCNRKGHIREKCWTLHGRPPNFEARPPARAHLVHSPGGGGVDGIQSIPDLQTIMSEIQSLKSMMNSPTTVMGSTSVANSGKNQLLTFISLFTKDLTEAWILDSGATDHMTSSEKCFETYEKIAPGKHVQTADGTLLLVIGIGSMTVQPIGTISNVLHVPKLFINLISVQKLAKMREYNIVFDDVDAYLCHKVLGWKIRLAKVQQGLYYLPCQNFGRMLGTEHKVAAVKKFSKEEIMETHQRMGHPSFSLLKHLYPHLFKDFDICTLSCDAC